MFIMSITMTVHVRVTMFVYLRVRVLFLLRGMSTSSMKRDSE
jgi:hypothetical protein